VENAETTPPERRATRHPLVAREMQFSRVVEAGMGGPRSFRAERWQAVRIAQVSPLFEAVPPKLYGGTERVVHYLTEELVRQGHDVTLYASGDSVTSAKLVPICERALRLDPGKPDPLGWHVLQLERVWQDADRFDLIHFHIDTMQLPMIRRFARPHVTTVHGRLDLPHLVPLYREFSEVPLVSISYSQRQPLAWANWQETVYHGLPTDLYTFREKPASEPYLVFVGRLCPEKRPDRAIEIARRAGLRLKVAAKIDAADVEYFEATVEPLLATSPHVEYLGELEDEDKGALVGGATALVFPIDWPEPFGLVLIEALACGTPVVAWRCGSVPELVSEGETGFVVDTIDDAVAAVESIGTLSRARCRAVFEERFSAPRMTEAYGRVYRALIDASSIEHVA
jgi:glycosyltransferase involved in cell wall biosynthesis